VALVPAAGLTPGFAADVRSLHGRDLCCCCAPLACHADVLASAAAFLSRPDML